MTDDRCHDTCKQKGTHSICHLAPTLKRPILDQMLQKLSALGTKMQDQRKLAQYMRLERLAKA